MKRFAVEIQVPNIYRTDFGYWVGGQRPEFRTVETIEAEDYDDAMVMAKRMFSEKLHPESYNSWVGWTGFASIRRLRPNGRPFKLRKGQTIQFCYTGPFDVLK